MSTSLLISIYDAMCSGCEPLTPDDIAEVIVFAASRRQNVVIADTLIFPSHQVSLLSTHVPGDLQIFPILTATPRYSRRLRLSCTGRATKPRVNCVGCTQRVAMVDM